MYRVRNVSTRVWLWMAIALVGLPTTSVFAQEKALPPPGWLKEPTYLHATAEQREAWERAWERIMRLRTESSEAIEEQMKLHLDPVFKDARPKARAFAEDILSVEGKFHHAVGALEKFFSDTAYGIGQLFGAQQMYQPVDWSDRFMKHANERFVRMVLDPDDIKRAVAAAANGYLTKRKELEIGLLVDLAADLPDGALGPDASPPDMSEELRLWATAENFTFGLGDDANVDAGTLVGRMVVSTVVADKLTEKQPDGLRKLATNYAVSNEIENGLEGGMKLLGIDPAGAIAAKVVMSLDSTHIALMGRTDNYSDGYEQLMLYHLTHHDGEVRAATGKAATLIEKHALLGLRPKLQIVHHQRNLALRRVLYRLLLNADVPLSAFLFIDGEQSHEELLTWAADWTLFYEDYSAWRKTKETK